MKPLRLTLVQGLCKVLPPAIAYKPRNWIYSMYAGQKHHDEYEITTLAGAQVKCRVDDYAGYLFCTQGYAEWRNWATALAICGPGDSMIEVGAQYGLETTGFARILARQNGQLHTFEPLPSNLITLKALLAANDCRNVSVHPAAASDSYGRLRFVTPPVTHSGIGHALSPADSPPEEGQADDIIEVESLPLDSLIPDLPRVRLICVDVEGYEIPVLRGAKQLVARDKPVIIVEADRDNQAKMGFSLNLLRDEMHDMGYNVYRLNRFGLDLADPQDPYKHNWNWLSIHKDEPESTRRRIAGLIRRCGMLPPLRGLNPLVIR